MSFEVWLPTIAVSTVVWFGRKWIAQYLVSAVQHSFNKELEELRAQLKAGEELFKAELKAKEAEISALRSGALSALESRQIALDKRRIQAVDEIWESMIALGPARSILASTSVLNLNYVSSKIQTDPKLGVFLDGIGAGFEIKNINHPSAERAKPFVTTTVWAAFSAIRLILGIGAMQLMAARGGLKLEGMVSVKGVKEMLSVALPEHATKVSQHPDDNANFHEFIDLLDAQLLTEVTKMLSGVESDESSVRNAMKIVELTDHLQRDASKSKASGLSATYGV